MVTSLAHILLVEDDPGDIELARIAFEDARLANELHVVGDGDAALAFLRQEGVYREAPRPDLVLLDLNLPRTDGRTVLGAIKRDPDLRRIPVIVMTTSNDDRDVLRSYDLHANAYIVKPVDFQQFVSVVRRLDGFWLAVVTLPPH